jgi:DnaJ domain
MLFPVAKIIAAHHNHIPMKLDSKIFDKIRIKSAASIKREAEASVTMCEWPGCDQPAKHKAPKGRSAEGQFYNYCTPHVQQYNKTYNYFDGMKDDEQAAFRKEAQTGHRPTWKRGQGPGVHAGASRRTAKDIDDPLNLLLKEKIKSNAKHGRNLRRNEIEALQTLNLAEDATPAEVKSTYKTLVKRLHPDANNGSRANEETLKAVIKAYDVLRASGFC